MKRLLPVVSLFILLFTSCGDSTPKDRPADSLADSAKAPIKTGFNQALADSLGADKYGMKSYVLVILKTGPAQVEEGAGRDSLFAGHMANIVRLEKEGKIVVAGPLEENEKAYRGIFIMNVKTTEEAKTLLQADPTVKAGIFEPELYPWYGSAALPLYLKYHDAVQKESF